MVYAGQLALCSCLINCFEQGLSLYQSECTGAEAQIDFREPLPTHRAWCDDENTEIRRAQRLTRSHNGSILRPQLAIALCDHWKTYATPVIRRGLSGLSLTTHTKIVATKDECWLLESS